MTFFIGALQDLDSVKAPGINMIRMIFRSIIGNRDLDVLAL
jgi:hypothetical protein